MSNPSPDPAAAPTWELRFRAGRVGVPQWALDAPDRCAVVATASGALEVHSYDVAAGELRQLTARPEGTSGAVVEPSGDGIWWFDDTAGDEHGRWRRQPFGAAPGESVTDPVDLPAAYSAGLALGRSGRAVVGLNDDGYGTRVVVVEGGQARTLYEHREDAWVADLSLDEEWVALSHSEHGDSRHPDLRVVRTTDGSTVVELADGPGKGVAPVAFAPRPGDPRLLVEHERSGRAELLVLDVTDGSETPIALDAPGEVAGADWTTDAGALLVLLDHEARTRLYRHDLAAGTTTLVGPTTGSVGTASARPDGDVWFSWSSAAEPSAVRRLDGSVLLTAPGHRAPGSVPVHDVWAEGPGGRVHGLLRLPDGADGPLPLVVEVHGGPTHHDTDSFGAYPATWVDEGFAHVQVNYRGSTGYGSAWRDAIEERIGHVELADVAAVVDRLVADGIADPARLILGGASWGGFCTLLGLGIQPDRWALGLAGVPVADYVAAYEDEMEGLKAFDRSLFGGSPEEVPEKYRDASPLTYVDAVRVPVLILAGENDPRCPIRQIENYVARLEERGLPHQVYRYDAGHGSLLDDERVAQMRTELEFVRRHLGAGTTD
ncbi:prolyl oligopeptidase family serine peptidase [Kineococcus gynurae]|uniref:Prolyl oligopeptidase family serine peptidase n=1 Tax=Kineococcus gynurae TaxID=452979 RepID=A0ABV5LU10_9ACTN